MESDIDMTDSNTDTSEFWVKQRVHDTRAASRTMPSIRRRSSLPKYERRRLRRSVARPTYSTRSSRSWNR